VPKRGNQEMVLHCRICTVLALIRHPIDELLPTAAGCCPLLAKSRPAQRSDGAGMSRLKEHPARNNWSMLPWPLAVPCRREARQPMSSALLQD
jgi:hypothetical protein